MQPPPTQTQRATSAVCLLCASCRRSVTPCLVCAHLLPCCSCSLHSPWLECWKCHAKNPLGDQGRRILGFPPALALPASMVRRVLIAHIGRPMLTMVTHLYHQRIQEALTAKLPEDVLGTQALMTNDGDSCAHEKMISSRFPSMGLPFVQSDGIMTSFSFPLQKQIFDANADNHMLLDVSEDAVLSCIDCSRSCSCLIKFGNNPTDRGLRRCREQLVALYCAEALSSDLNGSTYPICNTVLKSALQIQEKKTCNLRIGRDCSSGMGKGLSVEMLRAVSSVFIKDFETWLATKETPSLETCKLEDLFRCVEAFMVKQDHLMELQRSMLRAAAAQKQIAVDSKANPSCFSTACVLEQLYTDRSKERMQKITRAVEPYQVLLKQINLFLEYLCIQTHALAATQLHPLNLCTTIEGDLECNDTFVMKRQLQIAFSHWLLLYHDVAHALSLI